MDIRCYLIKNETETATAAPYMWRVVPNGVANLNDIITDVLGRINSSEQRVRMALAEAQKVALEHVLAGKTVDLGGIRIKLQIPGSSPCEDTPFNPTTDVVIVSAYIDDELRDTFDGVSPVKITASAAASAIKVSNVMDVATEQFGTVIGSTQYAILGNGITLDGEGEYVKALDKKTGEVKGTATVVSVSKGQRAYCKFNPQLAAGDYTLEIATKGLIGEATPRVFHKPVTAVYVAPVTPPTVTKLNTPTEGFLNTPGDAFSIEGTGLQGVTSVEIVKDADGSHVSTETVTWNGTKLVGTTALEFIEESTDCKMKVTTAGGSALSEKFTLTCH